jgi:hypothetical protein
LIFYPKENHNISEYTLAIIASNNVFSYLLQHVLILKNLNIIFKKLIVADIGLLGDQRKTLIGILGDKIEFVDFKNKNFNTGFKTQSDQYRRIIDNRISFLKQLFENEENERVIQLDADTSIIRNDFSMLDKDADVSLTVRPVTPWDHILGQFQVDYPNCGVIFWNNPKKCLNFLDAWERYKNNNPPKDGQYEQNYFLHACLEKEFKALSVQKIHCAYYNCYEKDWLNDKTSILHYKGSTKKFGKGGGDFESRSDYLNELVFGKKIRFN